MFNYLLDTHTAIWFFNDSAELSSTADKIISEGTNRIFLSITSAWELAIKIGIGKMEFNGKSAGFLQLAEKCDITILPIKAVHLTAFENLPFIHRDPFDRLIIATALAEQMTLITDDGNIARYEIPIIW